MQFNKQKLWTLEILTSNVNSLMLNFARSSHATISSYYDQLMTNKFKENKSSKIKYSIILILSFLYYQKNHYFLDLYYWILCEFEDRQVFELFVETKSLTLSLQNLDDIAYINLDLMYLEYNEMIYVINKALGFDPSQVQQFFNNQTDFVKEEGQQSIALERNGETNVSVFLGQVVREFILKSENKEEKKQEEVEKAKERISNLQGLPRRDTGLRELVTSHIDEDQLRQIQNEAKYEEIDQLKDQIRRQKCLQNDYKRSTISLMASLTILDPLVGEIKQKFRDFQEKLEKSQKSMTESQLINLENRKMNMKEATLSLKKGSVRKLNKTLLHVNPSLYKKIQSRIQEAIPKKKTIREKLKKKILSDELKDMLTDSNEIEKKNFKKLLLKLLSKKPNYGELCLLANFYNNKEDNEDDTISIENNLQIVSDKLVQMIDQLSDGKDLIRTESTLMRNYDTAQQKIDLLNQMNSQDYVKYHTNPNTFTKKEPSKIDELIENKKEKVIEEQIINPKKKTLASTFEFIEQGDLKDNLQSTQNDPPQDDRKSITDMNEECLEEQNSMRENSDIEEDNMNATELEKSEMVKTKNLVEEEPPLNQSESVQKTEVDQGIHRNEFETLGFKQTFGGTEVQLDYKDQSGDSKIEIDVKDDGQEEENHEMIEEDVNSEVNEEKEMINDEEEKSEVDEDKELVKDEQDKSEVEAEEKSEVDEDKELVKDEQDKSEVEEDKSEVEEDKSEVEEDKSEVEEEKEMIDDEEDKKSKSSKSSDKKSKSSKSSDKKSKSSHKSLQKSSKKDSIVNEENEEKSEINEDKENQSENNKEKSDVEEEKEDAQDKDQEDEKFSDMNEEENELEMKEEASDMNEENELEMKEDDASGMNEENEIELNEEGSDINEENDEDLNQEDQNASDMNEENSELDLEGSKEIDDEEVIKTDIELDDQVNQSQQRIRQVESFYERRKTELLDEDKQIEQLKMQNQIEVSMKEREKEHVDSFVGRYSSDISHLVKDTEIIEEYFSNRQIRAQSKDFKKKQQIIQLINQK